MPSGSSAAEPRASLTAGMPNRIRPPTPASTASAAALRRLSLVCWTTPGMDDTGCGSAMPSLTNSGSTRSAGRTLGLRDQPAQRCGAAQPARPGHGEPSRS